ncbi:hypothetical protein AYO44_09555 [Planctomycetaceae bacterium SCGC AG-212-F19]|nr:hypothetical protein AYO44_09555 [Planctomycetaceae bacterium SCGC AG-212-F19]
MRQATAWSAVLFLGIQLGAGLLLDYGFPFVRFPSAGRVLHGIQDSPEPVDVVCLGSSRFEWGIRPDEIQRAVQHRLPDVPAPVVANAAVPAGDPVSSAYLLDRMLAEGVRPRIVVIEISPETITSHTVWMYAHVRRQFRWDDLPGCLLEAFALKQGVRLLTGRLLPLYEFRQEVLHLLADLVPDNPDPAPSPADAAAPLVANIQREGRAYEIDRTRAWLREYAVGGRDWHALNAILARCREHGIAAVLVGIPVTGDFRHEVSPAINAAFLTAMDRACRTYGCRFVDCRDRLPDEGFFDIHHMNDRGAGQFSRLLGAEILAPLWRDLHGSPAAPSDSTLVDHRAEQ